MESAAVVYALLVLAYAATAALLGRAHVSAPLAFLVAGSVAGFAGHSPTAEEVVWVKAAGEMTLALILFHDAAQVRLRELRTVSALAARLLLIGWPLTVLATWAEAAGRAVRIPRGHLYGRALDQLGLHVRSKDRCDGGPDRRHPAGAGAA